MNSALPFRRRTAALAVAVATLAVVGLASSAQAHVTVGADDPHQGASDAVLTFRVPDEDATASTVKVAVSFPKQTPLASVKPATKPGWTVSTTKVTFNPPITTDDGSITEGVSQVVWTASSPASAIPPGGFDAFQVLVGPLPDKASTLTFPTVQTYSTGRTAAWIQPVTDPSAEPEDPAPVLHLLPADAGAESAGAADASSGAAPAAASPAAGSGDRTAAVAPVTATGASADDVDGARTLAVAGLVVGAVGLLVGAGGLTAALRRRSRA